jgi:plastocyanin
VTRLRTLLLLVAACAAGCSSSSATGSGSNGSGSAGSTAPPPGTVLGGGHFTIGKKVSITSTGFDPQVLYTPIGSTVTWTNRSDGPQSVHFDNWDPTQPVDSGSIPPGGTWKFTFKTTGSVVYHSTQNPSFRATVQIRLTE